MSDDTPVPPPASPSPPEAGAEVPAPAADAPAAPRAPEMESSLPDDVPRITVAEFEGPLDLLLYLIRREKVDIHDIPIAPITHRYMEYLDLMQTLSLDLAGEFMLMAATLIHIKSKMLVPVDPTEVEGEEAGEDPRDELVQRLLEFQRYKDAAAVLHERSQIRAATWLRPDSALPRFDDAGEEMLEAGLFDLIAAFKELLDRRQVLLAHEVESEGQPIEDRMAEILVLLQEGESREFIHLFEGDRTKAALIVTFLAILELIRLKRVRVYQREAFGVLRVFRPVGPAEAAPQPAS